MASHHERRITIPSDLWDSVNYYIADERLKLPNEIRESLTPDVVIISLIKGVMIGAGYYPPKTEKAVDCDAKRD